jgi:hypothetical protein
MADRGVRATTRREMAPANVPNNSLLHLVPMEQFAIQYVDGGGDLRTGVVVKVGNAYYVPENSEQWTNGLKPAADWLRDIVKARLESKEAVPSSDGVDLMASGG